MCFGHLGEKLGKNFTAIEQRAYLLARDIGDQLPEECPDDISEFLNEVLQKNRKLFLSQQSQIILTMEQP